MSWIGKILGAIFGYFLLGPVGIFLGLFVGHIFDRGISGHWMGTAFTNNQAAQKTFFDTTFAIMGHVAKSSGRVSERQIQLARAAMQRLGLQGDAMLEAMRHFKLGTQSEFDLNNSLSALKQMFSHRYLLELFMDLQVQTAYADGVPGADVKQLLQYMSQQLGLGGLDFSQIEALLYGRFYQHSSQGGTGYRSTQQTAQHALNDAYKILGVNSTATDAEIKQSYRRKMNENHPDKLIAKGLPKEMIDLATEKTQQISRAYEYIKKTRGF